MTTTVVRPTLAEYLATTYRPDREWIDGELRERNVGKYEHARLQALLAGWFAANEQAWGVQVVVEQRTQVAANRIRVPDVVLLDAGPQPEMIVAPPVLVVEILSPDDSYAVTEERAADYLAMPTAVWLIDPKTRTSKAFAQGWIVCDRLVVPDTEIFVDVVQLFQRLDQGRRKE